MKYLITLSMIALCLSAGSTHAANSSSIYVGAMYVASDWGVGEEDGFQWDDFSADSTDSVEFVGGIRLNQHLAIEGSYRFGFETEEGFSDFISTVNTTTEYQSIAADIVGFYPITKNIELLGSVGGGYIKADFVYKETSGLGTDITEESEEALFGRVGGGVELSLSDMLKTRAMVRYEMSDHDIYQDNISYGVGLFAHF